MNNQTMMILSGWTSKLPDSAAMSLAPRVEKIPEEKTQNLTFVSLKDPVMGLILGIFFGCFGVDRFYKGDILLGILKFVLLFVLVGAIWALIDLYLVWVGIKKDNYKKIDEQLCMLGV